MDVHTYKCPGGYCIGHSLVCDGIWDCSSGEDEIPNCSTRNCTGLFRCKGSNICVHFSDLCDAVTDCPYEDDEQSCNKFVCPAGCACLMHAMWCVTIAQVHIFSIAMSLNAPLISNVMIHIVYQSAWFVICSGTAHMEKIRIAALIGIVRAFTCVTEFVQLN